MAWLSRGLFAGFLLHRGCPSFTTPGPALTCCRGVALDVFLALFGAVTFRYSRVLRPTLGVIYDRRLRRLLWTIVKSLPNVAYISLTLLLIFVR